MDNGSVPDIAGLARIRNATAVAKNESAKRCVGDVVVRFAFGTEPDGVVLHWSRQDGMGNRHGRIACSWEEVGTAESDPLIAALKQAVVAVSGPAN